MKKYIKRIVSMLTVMCMCVTLLPVVTLKAEAASYDNTHENTGNQAYDSKRKT